ENLPIMQRLSEHAAPTWIEVSGPPTDTEAGSHSRYVVTKRDQKHCQKRLLNEAYSRSAYGRILLPYGIFSDVTVGSLLRLLQAGYQLVLAPVMRQIEEDVLDDLRRYGYLCGGVRLSLTGQSLTIPQRVLADLAIRHLHPEMAPFDQGRPVQPLDVPFRYW